MFDREVALYQRLQESGVQIAFVTYGGPEDLQFADKIPGIRILCNRYGLPNRLYRKLIPFLHASTLLKCDVIKTNQFMSGRFAVTSARVWRKPLIARGGYHWSYNVEQELGRESPYTQEIIAEETNLFLKATVIEVTTPVIAERIRTNLPSVESKLAIIPNYVDCDLFDVGDGASPKDYDIVFVGRSSPEKNLDALLRAIRDTSLTLALIGGSGLDEKLKQEFSDCAERISWIGNVPNSLLPTYLRRSRIFILPSHYEGHPKSLIEAMSCGLPVIGADSPGIREVIHHGKTGLLCSTDSSSIRDTMISLINNPELQLTLGANARQHTLEYYSLKRIVNQELQVLQRAIKR